MKHQTKPSDVPPQDLTLGSLDRDESDVDLTKICWTQLLREAETEDGQLSLSQRLRNAYSAAKSSS